MNDAIAFLWLGQLNVSTQSALIEAFLCQSFELRDEVSVGEGIGVLVFAFSVLFIKQPQNLGLEDEKQVAASWVSKE